MKKKEKEYKAIFVEADKHFKAKSFALKNKMFLGDFVGKLIEDYKK